jgi:hypothetical protein
MTCPAAHPVVRPLTRDPPAAPHPPAPSQCPGHFQRLTTADEGDERKYELPGAWGTGGGDDYSKAVIIITDLTDTDEAAFKKTYNIMADTK